MVERLRGFWPWIGAGIFTERLRRAAIRTKFVARLDVGQFLNFPRGTRIGHSLRLYKLLWRLGRKHSRTLESLLVRMGAFTEPRSQAAGTEAGTVFNLRPPVHPTSTSTRGGWIELPIYRFRGPTDGAEPAYGSLIFDPMGNIYGTTFQGGLACGDGQCGAVFKLAPSGNGSWTETAYDFPGFSDGGNPLGGVVMDASGNLYGTTTPNNFVPVVYELTPSGLGWTETALYTFTSNDYSVGGQGVILDGTGGLFGADLAAVYQLSPSGGQWNYGTMYSFPGDAGSWSTLTSDTSGNLYGTTCSGGTLGQGSVFKLSPSQNGWIETDLYDFTGTADGGCPIGGVTLDGTGNVYGTAFEGGAGGYGVVWEITP